MMGVCKPVHIKVGMFESEVTLVSSIVLNRGTDGEATA